MGERSEFISAGNYNSNEKKEIGREGEFWKNQEAIKQAYDLKIEELRKRSLQNSEIKKEANGSSEDVHEFMRENIEISLNLIENDLEKLTVLSDDLKNQYSKLTENTLQTGLKKMEDRIVGFKSLLEGDKSSEYLKRFNDAVNAFEKLKGHPKSFKALHAGFSGDIGTIRKMVVKYNEIDDQYLRQLSGEELLTEAEKISTEIMNQIITLKDPHEKADLDNLRLELKQITKNIEGLPDLRAVNE